MGSGKRTEAHKTRFEKVGDPSALSEEVSQRWWAAARSGDLEAAWRQSDRLLVAPRSWSKLPRHFRPLWDGTPVDGRAVLVRCWRGLGDAIHYVRYIRLLRSRARTVFLEVPPQLLSIFASLPLDGIFPLDSLREPPADLVEVESTELPYVFRTTLATIPCEVPYLQIPVSHVSSTRTGRLNVGLCWAGGAYDPRRAVPRQELAPLADVREVNWFQLQRDSPVDGLLPFMNLAEQSMDLLATAALISQLDLVITVDTMVAHLAGALAKPVWTLLHFDSDWRWFEGRADSPWYPTMRLFRQTKRSEWSDVVRGVINELDNLTSFSS